MPGSYLREIHDQVSTTEPLDLAKQLEIVFTIKERLAEKRDRSELVGYLRALLVRDDLLAKVALDIDEAIARYPLDPQDVEIKTVEASAEPAVPAWSVEVTEFVNTAMPSIQLQVSLSEQTHLVRWTDGLWYARLFVDGTEVAKSSDRKDDMEFTLSDGGVTRAATLHYRLAFAGAGRLLDLTVDIDRTRIFELES